MISSIQQLPSICSAPGSAQQEESKMKQTQLPLLEALKGQWNIQRWNWQQQQKMEADWKQVGRKCNILAREDEKLNQTVMNGEERRREWRIDAQVEPTRHAHRLDRNSEREGVQAEACFIIIIIILAWMIGKFDSQKD